MSKKKLMSEELYEEMHIGRKKYLGTIKLIGEMYNLGLLTANIFALSTSWLLNEANNENIERLCSLISTVGKRMSGEKEETVRLSLKNALRVFNDLAHSKKTSELITLESRIKFKILDTIDLNEKNWLPY